MIFSLERQVSTWTEPRLNNSSQIMQLDPSYLGSIVYYMQVMHS